MDDTVLLDPFGVPDLFCDKGLHSVVHIGGSCYRFNLATSENNGEVITAAKIVLPIELIIPAIYLSAATIGMRFLPVGNGRRKMLFH